VKTIDHGRTGTLRCEDWHGDWLRVALLPAAAVLVGIALLASAGSARANTYKWVDDKGVVHYSDKLPPEAADKNRIELNAQGVPIKKSERALTPEQVRVKEQEEARARLVAKKQEEIARRDRALLASYTSEREIDLARDRALRTLDGSVQSAEAYAAQLKIREADAEAKKAKYAGKPVPVAIERELESIAAESTRQSELIAQKKKEADAVKARYDADKQRWRELSAAKAVAEPAAVAPALVKNTAAAAPTTPTVKK
jgi:hypothetical protein